MVYEYRQEYSQYITEKMMTLWGEKVYSEEVKLSLISSDAFDDQVMP